MFKANYNNNYTLNEITKYKVMKNKIRKIIIGLL